MFGDKSWLAVHVQVQPKDVGWGLGQGSVQTSFFHTKLGKPYLYWPGFVHRGIVMLKQKTIFSKLLL